MIYTEKQFRARVADMQNSAKLATIIRGTAAADMAAHAKGGEMKWTPVAERLPEGNGIQCLVSEIREGEPVTSDAFFYDGATGDDADDDGPFWIGEWDAHQLTPYAWMPWPEPMAPTGEPQ